MKSTTLSALLLAASLLAVPACASHRQSRVADTATQVIDPTFEGRWSAREGRSALVQRSKKTGYTVTITDESGATSYDVDLLEVSGKRLVEIAVHDPTEKNHVPVYMYGRVEIKGNDITYRRLRNEWLVKAVKGLPDAVYKDTNNVQPNTGGVVVRDAAQMKELLEKAVADPTAFGDPETAHRVK